MTAPLIVGLSGTRLTEQERAFLEDVRPLGVILFSRNIATAPEIQHLCDGAKEAADCNLVFIDQEGGRVQRLGPPLARRYPPAELIGHLYGKDQEAGTRAAWLCGRLIGADLLPLGINAPCLPVADVPAIDSHDVIGDRAYAGDPDVVSRLAAAAAQGVLDAGCLPVVKHIPGHGRARADSHVSLPVVDASREELARDFAPFRALNGLPMAMSAHVTYSALDDRPATLSPVVIGIIREEIGFDGLLMTDDISMGALSGDVAQNAKDALAAGCDCVLHCNGDLEEMRRIADALPPLGGAGERRLTAALDARRPPDPPRPNGLQGEFTGLIGQLA